MLGELAWLGGVTVAVLGVLEVSHRREVRARELGPEAALRDAMAGEEGAAVRAEYRARGVQPVSRRREVLPFGWSA